MLNKLIGIVRKIYRNVLVFFMGIIYRAYWWLNVRRMLVYNKCNCNSGGLDHCQFVWRGLPKMHQKNMLLVRIVSCRNETSNWPLGLGAFKNYPRLELCECLVNSRFMGKTVLSSVLALVEQGPGLMIL